MLDAEPSWSTERARGGAEQHTSIKTRVAACLVHAGALALVTTHISTAGAARAYHVARPASTYS